MTELSVLFIHPKAKCVRCSNAIIPVEVICKKNSVQLHNLESNEVMENNDEITKFIIANKLEEFPIIIINDNGNLMNVKHNNGKVDGLALNQALKLLANANKN